MENTRSSKIRTQGRERQIRSKFLDNNPRHFTPQGINKHKYSGLITSCRNISDKVFPAFLTPMQLLLPFNINIITNGSYKIRLFLPIIFDSFFQFVRTHRLFRQIQQKNMDNSHKNSWLNRKLTEYTTQQYLIYTSIYRRLRPKADLPPSTFSLPAPFSKEI